MTGHKIKRSKRVRAFVGLIAASALVLAGCGSSSEASSGPVSKDNPVEVKLGIVNPINSPDYLMVVADKKGFFEEQGIKPTVIEAASTVTPLLAGEFDVTNLGVQGMVPLAQGQPLVFLGAVFKTPTVTLLVPKGSPLEAHAHQWPQIMQDLKGKNLGVTVAGGVLDNMAQYMATLAGMDPKTDLSIQAAGNASTLAANLESGTYDAALQVSPLWEKSLARGTVTSVLDMYKGEGPKELQPLPFTTPASTQKFLDAHPGFDAAFFKALTASMEWAKNPANKDELTQIIVTQTGQSAEELAPGIETFVNALDNPTYEQNVWDNGVAMLKSNGIDVSALDYKKDVVAVAQG